MTERGSKSSTSSLTQKLETANREISQLEMQLKSFQDRANFERTAASERAKLELDRQETTFKFTIEKLEDKVSQLNTELDRASKVEKDLREQLLTAKQD